MKDFFSVYDALAENIKSEDTIGLFRSEERWAAVGTESGYGVAMAGGLESIAPMLPGGFQGLSLREAAIAARSWNLREAGIALAACNAYYNSVSRMEALGCAEPYENYCTGGLELRGKTIGVVGHLHLTEEIRSQAMKIYILEREPQPGDYPDSACDVILPLCELVIMTGNTITNKTLPHLLELCRDAYTILTGPSVPMCPELLELGIDRLAGMVVTDRAGMDARVASGQRGNPYCFGQSFLLKR